MNPLKDSCGRQVTYLRLSVNDRCDLRCTYCMPRQMSFLSRRDVLGFDEMLRLCRIFMARGVKTLRITGGEPLIRRGIGDFLTSLSQFLKAPQGPSFEKLTITTNGTLLEKYASLLKQCGVGKINVSLDTLDPKTYYDITRGGNLQRTQRGIEAAREEGLNVRINTVALKGVNDHEYEELLKWCGDIGADFCIIETMPMGGDAHERLNNFLSITEIKKQLEKNWTFVKDDMHSAGPARYLRVLQTGQHIGFITPLSENFCSQCNRVRLSCNGKLYTCLGQENHVNLGRLIRENASDAVINNAINDALAHKPKGHDFLVDQKSGNVQGTGRFMNMTGG